MFACLLLVFITLDLVGKWRVGSLMVRAELGGEGQFSGAYHLGYPGGVDCWVNCTEACFWVGAADMPTEIDSWG